ncbi:sensor histidine kinase [Pedomonas mirosovicensis]|uniref:sensor histidine kinase n=1 Tax=Pedomonas mirosovicensis TaxID=2908641 RepID=UPI00216958C0|nr:sensor histidine kinase [Pedomonas mirosovicensis]MCH8686692.1 sensor histidine kinase [Pedomonas mirosovicensis]
MAHDLEAPLICIQARLAPAVIRGARMLASHAVVNLIDDAIKYTPPSGTVTVATDVDAGWVRLSIANTGLGIPINQRERVFTRFVQLDPSRATPEA